MVWTPRANRASLLNNNQSISGANPTSRGWHFNDSHLGGLSQHLWHLFFFAFFLALFSSFNITQSASIELLLLLLGRGFRGAKALNKEPKPKTGSWTSGSGEIPGRRGRKKSWGGVKAEEMQMEGVLAIKFWWAAKLSTKNPKINILWWITKLLGFSD